MNKVAMGLALALAASAFAGHPQTINKGQQRFTSGHCPAVEAVNDGEVRSHNYGQCPAIDQNGLSEQLQVVLADHVRVVIVGLQAVSVYYLHVLYRLQYQSASLPLNV